MRVADYIIERLYNEGIKHIFTVTGRGTLYLTDAVAKQTGLEAICTHHEQAAAFAAMSYAQYNDNLGACLVSTGVGATNALTALLCAWQDSVPCIFISGQNLLNETTRHTKIPIRTYGQQEADIIKLAEPISKYAVMIEKACEIAYEVEKAIYLAQNGRKGPVWIDIPVDVQNMRVEPSEMRRFIPDNIESQASKVDFSYLTESITNSKRPSVLIGSGIRSAKVIEEFTNFVEKYSFPVTYSHSAADTYGTKNDLSIGAVGSMGGTRAGNFVTQNSDLVLVLGSSLSTFTTGSEYHKFARDAKIIVVDIDNIEHTKNTVKIDKFLHLDLKSFFEEIEMIDLSSCPKEWVSKCLHWKQLFTKCEEQFKSLDKVNLYDFTESLSKVLPDRCTILTDAGLQELIIPPNLNLKKGQRCIHPAAQGSMGYALPASFGVHYSGGENVIAVIGDGSIMMNLQELQTLVYNNIPVKIIVISNNVYTVIRNRQQDLFRKRTIGTDPSNGVSCPDFDKVAKCFGIKYIKIKDARTLTDDLSKLMSTKGPVICEIIGDENQKYIHNSFTIGKNRKFVKRTLEDQSPFIDRDLFLSEMIIEPIDQ
jgi:acetolactate synthase I/II/III large subunit